MDTTALASSGLTGAVIASLYIFYKCFVRKKINSKCCCGEINITEEKSEEKPEEVKQPTPHNTPHNTPQQKPMTDKVCEFLDLEKGN
jgi:hypothetical protein